MAFHRGIPVQAPAERDLRFIPDPGMAQVFSLGFDALLSDYYWLQAVQIVGGSMVPAEHGQQIGRLVDVVTTLNPRVDHPYRFVAVWLTETREDVLLANRLLERGIENHPGDWRMRFYLAFNHFFYLGNESYAADVLEGALDLEGTPTYLRRMVARLRAKNGDLETASRFLEKLIETAPDGFARAEYLKAIDEIETERAARFLDQKRAQYRERNGRDIEEVADLARGPGRVLNALPKELHGWEWVIDEDDDRIVSSYYGYRYELVLLRGDRERRAEWNTRVEDSE